VSVKGAVQTLGRNQPEKHYIEHGGYDLIPLWYGKSYKVMAMIYTLTYMLFAVGVVLTEGGLLRQGDDALINSLATAEKDKNAGKDNPPTPTLDASEEGH